MAISRYATLNGPVRGTTSMSTVNSVIRKGVASGAISATTTVLEEGRRLDQISGQAYGTGYYWWVIAAASGIGWGLQVPAGTIIVVPTDLSEVLSLVI